MAKAKKEEKPKRLTLTDFAFETDYRLAAIADELELLNDLVDILWYQTTALERFAYDTPKKSWWRK